MRVPVADHRKVQVVGSAAAAQHRVEELPRLGAGGDPVHRVGGDSLGGVHRGGVAELGGFGDVAGRQGNDAAATRVTYLQRASVDDMQNGPAVTVFNPIGTTDADPPVVLPS